MKKLFLFVLLLSAFVGGAVAQNIQLHYDLGRALYKSLDERPWVTTTVEMFKADNWGSTYFFVDMDYTDKGVASAYWEISRELKFWKAPFSAHVEYNGGLNYINNAFLGGATYSWNNSDFSKTFGIQVLYKYIQKNAKPHNFQLTGTWTLNFWQGKFTMSGFADFWREKHTDEKGQNYNFIFISEPQFWINLNKFKHVNDNLNLSVGSEWELSTNFATRDGFYFIPTLAMKWSF
ncbi:DUF5020 family protein [Bacteroides mediterraneensis]|uniref:DUF5020 family protein n=1 Tax=Bacteroides mediterraneensis TaxID=1841856 RepID=A0ABS2EWS6_9BACE|nr:DUF5020 family protein [Bacteroides mediterraneensis]MBM6759142.1 DUF5020 family protein [Bacteroides mediterraneensis]MBM6781073.1 DUF5020 family protein [Bacteroides mediterraneensis]